MIIVYRQVLRVGGRPTTGLAPAWQDLTVFGGAAVPLAKLPVIRDLGTGVYEWGWDAERDGDVSGFLAVPNPSPSMSLDESIVDVECTRESGRILAANPLVPTVVLVQ